MNINKHEIQDEKKNFNSRMKQSIRYKLEQKVAFMEQQFKKGQDAIQFIEKLVEKGIINKNKQGIINFFRFDY